MSKTSASVSVLIPMLVLAMTVLAGAMIWVVLLSSHFGKQLNAPINSVPCEIIQQQEKRPDAGKPPSSSITPNSNHSSVALPSAEQCYKVDEILALNKALNMSDTISLLGVLLTVFTFIAPIFAYLTLSKERKSLENSMEKLDSSRQELEASIATSIDGLERRMVTSINLLPKILVSVEEFKSAYQTDVYQRVNRSATEAQKTAIPLPSPVDRDTSVKNEADALQSMRRSATDAHQIASQLLSLLDRDTSAKDAFSNIACYITDTAVIENARHIKMLKIAIRQLHDACYLGSDERKAALSDFLKETLKISPEDFKSGA